MDSLWTAFSSMFIGLLYSLKYVTLCHLGKYYMYITQEELKRRLTKTEVLVKERERAKRGTEKRLTPEDRTIIGILSEIDTQDNVAELCGVSQMTVSNVSRGLVSPQLGVDKELREEVKKGTQEIGKEKLEREKKIQDQLLTNLAIALGQVGENIHSTDAVEASKVAVDMSRILERVTGSREEGGRNRTAIIINVPAMKKEESYQVINV